MGILDELLTGGQRQNEYKDFVTRYEQGAPAEGYSDQEVLKRYGEVSHAVSPDLYAQAAQEALSKLSPEERAAFVKMLQDRAATRGVTLPRQVAPEPKELGQVLTDLHTKPGQLRDMLGGGAAQPQGQASGSSAIRHLDISDGQGGACGHRGDGGQACHGSVPNGVARHYCKQSKRKSRHNSDDVAGKFALVQKKSRNLTRI
jgi:hypothetical protein